MLMFEPFDFLLVRKFVDIGEFLELSDLTVCKDEQRRVRLEMT